jgi:hypothetical protein
MPPVNYAEAYGRALAQSFPYVLHFGALYNTPNNELYKPLYKNAAICYCAPRRYY